MGWETFALLEAVSEIGHVSPFLTEQFNVVISQSNKALNK